jgi:hypothetical protein
VSLAEIVTSLPATVIVIFSPCFKFTNSASLEPSPMGVIFAPPPLIKVGSIPTLVSKIDFNSSLEISISYFN